ncbi:hypothetical protein DH2020_020250 [Rehmannia glutinosa]|uniref:Aminotransferase-like plant mobile domain-containing protein n=1 Tax=Rehmannia glutinosa TaxID=99300 RepID=A0ABR0WHP7_REHGL
MASKEQKRHVDSSEGESGGDNQLSKRQRIDKLNPRAQRRSKPKVLVDTLASLKPSQKIAVVEMGFGSLLSLKIEDFNKKLTYWLVENFNALSSELVLDDGRRIHIETEDVGRVLGFPNGDVVIEQKKKSGQCALYDQWRTMFGKNNSKVTAGELAAKMIECVDGGDWFRRHFVTLVASVIIGNLQCGYINPLILNCLDDVSKIREFNWWDYTLNTLIYKRVKWDETNKIEFNGPVLFLTVFYLDRVSVLWRGVPRGVPRTLPTFASWTMEKVKKRISIELDLGGFGQGYMDGPYVDGASLQLQTEGLVVSKEKQSSLPGPSNILGKLSQACLASDVVEIISLIQDAPSDVVLEPKFSEIGVVAKNLICHKTVQVEDTRVGEDPVGSESQQTENIALLEKMEATICKRDEFEKWNGDKPSFSLGLTQEQNTGKWDAVVETSRFSEKGASAKTNTIVDGGKGVVLDRNEGENKNSEKLEVYRRTEPSQKKKTETLTSPFVERWVDVMSKLNEKQNMIVKWLFDNPV